MDATQTRRWALMVGMSLMLLVAACAAGRAPRRIEWAREFSGGKARELQLDAATETRLLARVREAAVQTQGALRLALTPERVQGYREKAQGLELAFAQAETLACAGGRNVLPTRVFIVWSGDLVDADGDSYVLLHGYPEYSAGPLKGSVGRKALRELLAALPSRKD